MANSKKHLKDYWFDLVLTDPLPGKHQSTVIIVGKKVSKKATVRNRIKRLLKIAVERTKKQVGNHNITIIARADFSKAKAIGVENRLNRLIGQKK